MANPRRCERQDALQSGSGCYLALDLLEDEGEVSGEVANGYTPQSLRSHCLDFLRA